MYDVTRVTTMALILVGLDGYLWFLFSRNVIKLGIACILDACILCITLLLEIMQAELTIIDRFLSVIGIFVVMTPWDNSIIILSGKSEAICLVVCLCY